MPSPSKHGGRRRGGAPSPDGRAAAAAGTASGRRARASSNSGAGAAPPRTPRAPAASAGAREAGGHAATSTSAVAKRRRARRARGPVQLSLDLPPAPPTWGGRRVNAGRKRAPGKRPSVPHVRRPRHRHSDPVHVTLRGLPRLPSFRSDRVFRRFREGIRKASHSGLRVVHYSVQHDHVHLLVEAPDAERLSRGVQGLSIRLARGLNRVAGRKGRVWGDRWHGRALTTPRAVRHALVYVLLNFRKHARDPREAYAARRELDPCSSALYLDDGWDVRAGPLLAELLTPDAHDAPRPVPRPRTWLARTGWRRHGLLRPEEAPAPSG